MEIMMLPRGNGCERIIMKLFPEILFVIILLYMLPWKVTVRSYVSIEGDGRNIIYVTMKVTSRHGSDGRNMFNVAWR